MRNHLTPAQESLSRKTRARLRREWMQRGPNVVNSVLYGGPLGTVNTDRGQSGMIWKNCPWEEIKSGAKKGMWFEDDFTMFGNAVMSSAYTASIGQWTAYGHAGATVTDGAAEGGIARIQSDGDQEGVALYSSAGAFRMLTTSTLALNQKLWYEARFARSSITTVNNDIFVGLMTPSLSSGLPAAGIPISTTDDVLSTTPSFFGFHSNSTSAVRGGMTEIANAFELASGTVNYPTNLTTMMASSGNSVLTAGGFVKVGFIFDPNGPERTVVAATARQTAGQRKKAMIRFFINNLEHPTFLTYDDIVNATSGQAFPTGVMSPVFAVMNTAGSSPGYLAMDWVRVAQLANT